MRYGFERVSLTIDLDAAYVPYNDEYAHGGLATDAGDRTVGRRYMHEIMHFWQALSQGFVANLALSEWLQLQEYESSARADGENELIGAFTADHPELGFSAWALTEALCRYWDIHVTGPHHLFNQYPQLADISSTDHEVPLTTMTDGEERYTSRAFDLVMQAEDDYAAPYRLMLQHLGSNNCVILFPLAGYFALQTRHPVEVFANSVRRLSESLKLDQLPRPMNIHEMWRRVFTEVRRQCERSSLQLSGKTLTPGWDVIERSALSRHPVYGHYLQLLRFTGFDRDFAFALPGDPETGPKLVKMFRPPATFFRDGRWESGNTAESLRKLQAIQAIFSKPENHLDKIDWERLIDRKQLADTAQDIRRRADEMRRAALLARYR